MGCGYDGAQDSTKFPTGLCTIKGDWARGEGRYFDVLPSFFSVPGRVYEMHWACVRHAPHSL